MTINPYVVSDSQSPRPPIPDREKILAQVYRLILQIAKQKNIAAAGEIRQDAPATAQQTHDSENRNAIGSINLNE